MRVARTARLTVVFVVVSLIVGGLTGVGGADERSLSDPDDSPSALDIASVSYGHGGAEQLITHTLTTYEAWDASLLAASTEEGSTWGRIFFTLNSPTFCCGSGEIVVKVNPDGSLYAIFVREGLRAYGRAWRPDDRSVTVEFKKSDFAEGLERYTVTGGTAYANPAIPECPGRHTEEGHTSMDPCNDYAGQLRHEVEMDPDVRIDRIRFDPKGPDTGNNGHINKEFIAITNYGTRGVNLKGWRITDKGVQNRYVFSRLSLGRGESAYLYSGRGRDGASVGCNGSCHTTSYLFWDQDDYVWDNASDRATLRQPDGEIADRCSYGRNAGSVTNC